MNVRSPETENDVPVVCGVCQTRIYASAGQIGQDVVCPDCHAPTRVATPPTPAIHSRPQSDGEYRLADESGPAQRPERELVKVICTTCHTLMYARLEHVGKRVKCPDCDTISVVPHPAEPKKEFRPPDTSDLVIEDAPPPQIDDNRKEIADRLMAQATEETDRKASERPQPPKDPLREGIYSFPFYANVIPLWVGTAIAVMVDIVLISTLIEMAVAGGPSAIIAVFGATIAGFYTFSIVGIIAPHFLTIIEFTADGYDKIPYWPSEDLLSRLRATLFGVNALAMSSMPGMLLISLLRPLELPMRMGLFSTVLLLPLVVLSMAEHDSVFAPYSRVVFSSIRRHYKEWSRFYIQVILLAIAIVAMDFLIRTVIEQAATRAPGLTATMTGSGQTRSYIVGTIMTFTVCLYAVIYCRLIGRMAWVIGNAESGETDDDEEAKAEVDVGGK